MWKEPATLEKPVGRDDSRRRGTVPQRRWRRRAAIDRVDGRAQWCPRLLRDHRRRGRALSRREPSEDRSTRRGGPAHGEVGTPVTYSRPARGGWGAKGRGAEEHMRHPISQPIVRAGQRQRPQISKDNAGRATPRKPEAFTIKSAAADANALEPITESPRRVPHCAHSEAQAASNRSPKVWPAASNLAQAPSRPVRDEAFNHARKGVVGLYQGLLAGPKPSRRVVQPMRS